MTPVLVLKRRVHERFVDGKNDNPSFRKAIWMRSRASLQTEKDDYIKTKRFDGSSRAFTMGMAFKI